MFDLLTSTLHSEVTQYLEDFSFELTIQYQK